MQVVPKGDRDSFLKFCDCAFKFMHKCAETDHSQEPSIYQKTISLLGALTEFFKADVKEHLKEPWVGNLLNYAPRLYCEGLYEIKQYTQSVISSVLNDGSFSIPSSNLSAGFGAPLSLPQSNFSFGGANAPFSFGNNSSSNFSFGSNAFNS